MNVTIELLRLLGSPYMPSATYDIPVDKQFQLFHYSSKNRITLFYLDAMNQQEVPENLALFYEQEISRARQTLGAIARISHLLTNAHIEHAVIKTLRPYISTTVDIDAIIFGNTVNYAKAVKTTQDSGYRKLARGPMSTTFQDPEMKIGVDLYKEIAVSYIPYIDKTKLADSIVDTELSNKNWVRTLTPECDLAIIIAHSLIKENMYTLSEYYTYIHYLERLDIKNLIQLAEETRLKSAVRTHTGITALLHKAVHKVLPNKLQQILNELGEEKLETALVTKNDFRMPHKYHPTTIIRCLLEIVKEEKTRKGMATQILHAFDPRFSQDFLKRLINHVVRETY